MRRRTNIYLDDEQCEALDSRAEAEGVSRAELIRRYLDEALGRGRGEVDHDLAILEETFGIFADVEVDIPDRGPGEREAELERRWR
ncbi:MAG TPA: CopG family transcriptional regulator [Acidimicrobiales bacterium]|nr:CopG family transcriptional regulator [Acidimicrobiales bacterium]